MRSFQRKYIFTLSIAAVLLGTVGGLLFHRVTTQARQIPLWLGAVQGKPHAVAWQHREIPLSTVNSSFRLNLPNFSPDVDWIVGVKPVDQGAREKMYLGIVSWEDAIDAAGKGKGLGLKRVSNIVDYPLESASVGAGVASFSNILKDDQTLVVYLEVAPLTRVELGQNGTDMVLPGSEGGSIVFDGQRESVSFEGPASFLNEMNLRKLRKESRKNGSVLTEKKETP